MRRALLRGVEAVSQRGSEEACVRGSVRAREGAMRPRTVIWFRSDLRLADNAVVSAAARTAAQHDIVPVYFYDPAAVGARNVLDRRAGARMLGLPKCGPFRAHFLQQAVRDLQQRLRALGSDLFVYCESPESVLPGAPPSRGEHRRHRDSHLGVLAGWHLGVLAG